MTGYCWREWACRGSQIVAGPFDTPEEAGRWRRDHPPLIDGQGPTLVRYIDGEQVPLEAGELACCYTEFAGFREEVVQRLDFSAESVRLP